MLYEVITVGLQNPNNPNEEPYAVVQLRQDNAVV